MEIRDAYLAPGARGEPLPGPPKAALDDTVFTLLPETCTLQATMNGSHHRALFFCPCQ
jgi:hypothetical protein